MLEESVHLPLMNYVPLGLRPTHDVLIQGLSTLSTYRAHNTMSHAETQATKARGRHGTEKTIMVPEPLASHAQPDLMRLFRERRQPRRIPKDTFLLEV
jgi:hypothetical protein